MKRTGLRRVKDYGSCDRWTVGAYNPHENIVVHYRRRRYELKSGHGTRDAVDVFRRGDYYYVLSRNYGLPYVGMSTYDLSTADHEGMVEPYGSVFLQESERVEETLGKRGEDKSAAWIIRVLEEYCGNE